MHMHMHMHAHMHAHTPTPTHMHMHMHMHMHAHTHVHVHMHMQVGMFNPGVDMIEPFVPCAVSYPPRRRAQRLSFMVWPTIGLENAKLQAPP